MNEGVKKVYTKHIPPEPTKGKLDKKSSEYKNKQRRLACIICFEVATQMLCYLMDGCVKIERYCDACASKINSGH